MATPLISPIKQQGGTLYTFPSASEDFTYSQAGSRKQFNFSKFALLDLPNIKSGSSGKNVTGIENIPSSYLQTDLDNYNISFAESFQNYCLNLETLLVSQSGYDASATRTVSERVFWKWLKELGAIRFREAKIGNPQDGGERTRRTEDNLNSDSLANRAELGKRFVEEDTRTVAEGDLYPYSRVVKYIGNIDAVNGVKYLNSSYYQIHCLVPNSVGSTPTVLFKSIIDDNNYKAGTVITHKPVNPLDTEYLTGRSYNDTHHSGLDMRAHFDNDTGLYSAGSVGVNDYALEIKKSGEDSFVSGWWYPNPEANSYFLEPTKLNDYRNDWMKIDGNLDSVSKEVTFLRSRLDGIALDFSLDSSYSDNLEGKYRTWEDYNRSELATDFEYNTMLIYYDLVDLDDPSKTTTNLYGVYFLDNWTDTVTDGGEISRRKKFKPNTVTRQNGNADAFDINLKLDLNAQDVVAVNTVNEYNNYSMHLYGEALNVMKETHDRLLENINGITVLQDKIDQLEDLITNSTTISDLEEKMEEIEESLLASKSLFENSDEIISLIERNYDEVLNIYKNFTSVEMSYNLDVIKNDRGATIDKTIPGLVKIGLENEGYNLPKNPIVDWDLMKYKNDESAFYHSHVLNTGANYFKLMNDKTLKTDSRTLSDGQKMIFYIDDSNVKWREGQSLKVSFQHEFILSEDLPKAITFLTDSINRTQSEDGSYSIEMGSLSGLELSASGNKPILEFICVDSENLEFTLDIIR